MATEALRTKDIVIGWVLASDIQGQSMIDVYQEAIQLVLEQLRQQFPEFAWHMPFIQRRRYAPRGALRPLPLLEFGAQEKLLNKWDYAVVVVANDLEPRRQPFALGVPSSALETAVLSSSRLGEKSKIPPRLAGLALHELGHLFSLEHADEGPMCLPSNELKHNLSAFPEEQALVLQYHFQEVADARLEEEPHAYKRRSTFRFYLRAFVYNFRDIMKAVWGYRPWRIPLYLGRLTAAVAVSLLVLLLTAESWEVGANVAPLPLLITTLGAILVAAAYIFVGQHIGQVGKSYSPREQVARSRIVLFLTLLLGMISLWLTLYGLLFVSSLILPLEVVAGWAGYSADTLPRSRYLAFMATVGILAGALGGNLEEENEIKAQLFFDEET